MWGPAYVDSTHYLRIYVGHLRQKLEDDPAQPRHFVTETGVGYRFNPEPESAMTLPTPAPTTSRLSALTLAALGVVYGDIGTSPCTPSRKCSAAPTIRCPSPRKTSSASSRSSCGRSWWW